MVSKLKVLLLWCGANATATFNPYVCSFFLNVFLCFSPLMLIMLGWHRKIILAGIEPWLTQSRTIVDYHFGGVYDINKIDPNPMVE